MKFILLENPEYRSGTSLSTLEDSFVLINLDQVISFVLAKETQKGMMELKDGRTFYLSKEECGDLLNLINDPKIIRTQSLGKIRKSLQ